MLTTLQQRKVSEWESLTGFLRQHWHNPDTQAVLIALSLYASHLSYTDDPVWVMVIGASGSGKSRLIAGALDSLPDTHLVDSLTESSLISGFNKETGLLRRFRVLHGISQGIVTIPDMSGIIGINPHERPKMLAAMRKLYDGKYDRPLGNMGPQIWTGKCSILACATPSVERYWKAAQELGQRFLFCKGEPTEHGDNIKVQRMAMRQISTEAKQEHTYQTLVRKFVDTDSVPMLELDENRIEQQGLYYISNLTAYLRQHVARDSTPNRDIVDIEPSEFPTRIVKGIAQIARGSAALFRRSELNDDDIELARRIALSSIPTWRRRIIQTLWGFPGLQGTVTDIAYYAKIPPRSLKREVEELVYLGHLTRISGTWMDEIKADTQVGLSPLIQETLYYSGVQPQVNWQAGY